MGKHLLEKPDTQLLIYQAENGETKLEVRLEDETVWLTQKLMAELFQVTIPTINEHIKNIYNEAELGSEATIRKFRIVQKEGKREVSRAIDFYNLDMIISVGYRIKSRVATHFRQWATNSLFLIRAGMFLMRTMAQARRRHLSGCWIARWIY